mmetsp:Transcript_27232/g.51591  ORF Transcript_27232/g.51591 Transcript_27232/m.51591 type:complete len:399 (+) Transcript_27232:32-1228(+)
MRRANCTTLSLLLSLLLTTSFVPSLAEDEEFEEPSFESSTACLLNFNSQNLECEHSIFAVSFQTTTGRLVGASPSDGNTACEGFRVNKDVVGNVALASRGQCPFYQKALELQAAGAAAVIIGDNEPDTQPVRLKGTGNEEALVSIPVVMVSQADYEMMVGGDGGDVTISIDEEIMLDEQNPLYEEFHLKGQLMTSLSRPEFLMQLGAYMERSGWRETARVFLTLAASLVKSPSSYNIPYSVGEYFHNIEEDVDVAAKYFKAAAHGALEVLQSNSRAARDEARKKLIETISLVPERDEQREIINLMSEKGLFTDLRETLIELYEREKLGTTAVLTWAQNIKEVGYSRELMKVLDGAWVEQNQMQEDENWVKVMENAKKYVVEFMEGKVDGRKGGESSEL